MTVKGLMQGVATGLLLLAAAGSVRAQGMFYAEETKDGRIYVFAIAKEHELWSKSGETGKAITRLGYGPNGETVIFDSEQAIGLFNFKHGKPGEAFPEPKKPKMSFAWKDGKTSFESDKATLTLSNRVQVRYTHELPDDTVTLAGTGEAGAGKGSWRIRRAKTKFEGWFYNKNLSYELQLNWPDLSGTPASRALEDAWLNWDVSKDKRFQVKLGQFKVPFGRQELTSSGSQQFVDRTDVSNRYARGRETGFQVHGLLASGKVDWRAGFFNGNGRSNSANDNDAFQYNARLAFQPNGDPKYSEADFDSKDRPLWGIGVAIEHNDKSNATASTDTKDFLWALDGVFKYRGLFLTGEFFSKDADPETGDDFKDEGWYGQGGLLLGARKQWELALRYGQIDPSDLAGSDKRTELGGALSYYYNKHNLKVQADYRRLKTEGASGDVENDELRVQTQFIF